MRKTIGFLGCGNMGGAIARAVCKAADPQSVWLANRTPAGRCDLIFLAVKPQMMEELLAPLRFTLAERPGRFVLCSMAAGLSIGRIQEMAGGDYPVIRIMPNTPASVGAGMIQYCTSGVTAEEEADFLRLMACPGPKRRSMPPRWCWAAQSWCSRAASTPAHSRTPCAAPAAAPSRACGCWKKRACGAR